MTTSRKALARKAIYWLPAILLGATWTSGEASASEPMRFTPHRAVYEWSLADTGAGSGVIGITGRMVYQLDGSACKGYTQKLRFVTIMTGEDGANTLSDLRSSSWEEADGKKLRFSVSQYQNDQLADASQGNAASSLGGATPTAGVDLIKPTKKRVTLPSDVYFPMKHANSLTEAAKSGVKMFLANVYDGSEKGEKYNLTNTIIGKQFPTGDAALPAVMKGNTQLADVASWPLTISYFDGGKNREAQAPDYQMSYRYFENGITSDLKIDYGKFTIKGELKQLTFLEQGKCPAEVSTPH